MPTFGEMKVWVRYTPEDTARLSAFLPVLEPHLVRIIDVFYDEVQRHPDSAAVLEGPAQVERLKRTLVIWLREVFQGPHDAAYASRREAIGRRHVEVGLPDRYMFTAMHLIEREVTAVVIGAVPEPWPLIESLRRVLTIDLALMTGTYVTARERQQLESLQALLVRHLRLSVLLVDAEGRVRASTSATAQRTGEPVLGLPWQNALPHGLLEAGHLESHVRRALSRHREVSLPRVDVPGEGAHQCYRVHLVPLRHELATLLIQVEDLTDALEMEARLRRSESLAQLGSLSAAVAHELRNPLAGISGALQVITRSMPAEAPHTAILHKVDAEVRRLNSLVTDLLQFSRPGAVHLQEVPLEGVVREVLEMVTPDHPHVRFEVNGVGVAWADANLLRQILHNLLRNAVDAVEGKGLVQIDVKPGSLRVSDDGPGVPEAKRAEIFQPFFTTKTRGTGLGLAISLRSARSMRADLRLVEGPLRGACFEMLFGEQAVTS